MLIDIELLTKPKTIPRIEASKQIERTATTIDKAIRNDEIDHAKLHRLILVVDNAKWRKYKKRMLESVT